MEEEDFPFAFITSGVSNKSLVLRQPAAPKHTTSRASVSQEYMCYCRLAGRTYVGLVDGWPGGRLQLMQQVGCVCQITVGRRSTAELNCGSLARLPVKRVLFVFLSSRHELSALMSRRRPVCTLRIHPILLGKAPNANSLRPEYWLLRALKKKNPRSHNCTKRLKIRKIISSSHKCHLCLTTSQWQTRRRSAGRLQWRGALCRGS